MLLSRCTAGVGGSLRGQGWKYGSGFVDGVFPVLSPIALEILNFVQKEEDVSRIWYSLDTLPPTNTTWDDLISIAVRLRLNKKWDPIIVVRALALVARNVLYYFILFLPFVWRLRRGNGDFGVVFVVLWSFFKVERVDFCWVANSFHIRE